MTTQLRSAEMGGFTLLEVLVALSVLAIASAGIGPAFFVQAKHNHSSEIKTGAIQAAQLHLDQLRNEDPLDMPSSGSDATPTTVNVGDHSFQVKTYYCLTSSYCPSTRTKHLTVRVSYDGAQVYELETVFTKLR